MQQQQPSSVPTPGREPGAQPPSGAGAARARPKRGLAYLSVGVVQVLAACGIVFIMWGFASAALAMHAGLDASPRDLALLYVGQLALLYLCIVVHEAGHLVAGWLVGFQFRSVTIGSIKLRRTTRGPRVGLVRGAPWFGGAALSIPLDDEQLIGREIVVAAGGPVASLLFAVFALVALLGFARGFGGSMTTTASALARGQVTTADFWILYALAIVVVWSFATFVGNAIPLRLRGKFNDGAKALALARGGAWAERFRAYLVVYASSVQGRRPREWTLDALLRAAVEDRGAETAMGMSVAVLAYYWALDRGDVAGAGHYITRATALGEGMSPVVRSSLALEAACFTAFHAGDAGAARAWLVAAKRAADERHTRLRAEAAVLLAEGRWQQAYACAGRALRLIGRADNPGIARAETDWLHAIAARARLSPQPAPVAPSAQQPTLA